MCVSLRTAFGSNPLTGCVLRMSWAAANSRNSVGSLLIVVFVAPLWTLISRQSCTSRRCLQTFINVVSFVLTVHVNLQVSILFWLKQYDTYLVMSSWKQYSTSPVAYKDSRDLDGMDVVDANRDAWASFMHLHPAIDRLNDNHSLPSLEISIFAHRFNIEFVGWPYFPSFAAIDCKSGTLWVVHFFLWTFYLRGWMLDWSGILAFMFVVCGAVDTLTARRVLWRRSYHQSVPLKGGHDTWHFTLSASIESDLEGNTAIFDINGELYA